VHTWSRYLINRPDTLFGVCEGVGQDFGFNPLYLRIAVMMLWSPVAVFASYATLAVGVGLSRWMVPDRHRGRIGATTPGSTLLVGENDRELAQLAA
jgi:phage shock protein PspC (stress-responsive transcriptional regulator)